VSEFPPITDNERAVLDELVAAIASPRKLLLVRGRFADQPVPVLLVVDEYGPQRTRAFPIAVLLSGDLADQIQPPPDVQLELLTGEVGGRENEGMNPHLAEGEMDE
jgi:hypothetical protein